MRFQWQDGKGLDVFMGNSWDNRHDLPSDEDLLEEYISTGKSYEELAEKYNCSKATICRRIGKVN